MELIRNLPELYSFNKQISSLFSLIFINVTITEIIIPLLSDSGRLTLVKLSIQHMRMLAWLALIAMLMIFIAPSISAHLSQNSLDNNEMMTAIPMSEEHAEHMAMMSHGADESQSAGHNMADMAAGACFDFCGYCSLFHHNPSLIVLPAVAPTPDRQRPPSLISIIYYAIALPLFTHYQTRAPPLFYRLVK
ncbi:DUF2946 domain-containing protein [Serratia quinivorans]|uniref:DUF2946 domain-containing protein n=1 Tax=Serratia quinivorans TaxID=137545 RepID=UPI00217C3E0D|nr:DUF2946 domain-containing protein [Serratia quinivorans]CAI1644726.1 Protein of uncharacterised function (DUF2946) [Serratia quinivorans]CAI1724869.1 Protein of uncharacterised function (DUF2946) [Serratia quinivorans]